MKHASTVIFVLATIVLAMGLQANFADGRGLGSIGTMAMNTYYILATAIYAAAIAAHMIWGERRTA